MDKRRPHIPTNHFATDDNSGIVVERLSARKMVKFEEATEAHRHDLHSFFLLQKGRVLIEIDFRKHILKSPSLIYMHPDQVHTIKDFSGMTVFSCAISNENLNPEYLKLLEGITPAKPLRLDKATFSILSETLSLCLKFSKRENDKLHYSLLRDSCNAFVSLVLSQYLEREKASGRFLRSEIVTKTFKELLAQNFRKLKSPGNFARKLNISTAYLNECVKKTTGFSVTYHIQQRTILEAKRLLVHSDKSIKEIAEELGYEDAAYFSRLFTRVAGMSAMAFRQKK